MMLPVARCAGMTPILAKSPEDAEQYWHADCFPPGYTADKPTVLYRYDKVLPHLPMENLTPSADVLDEMRWKYGSSPIVFTIREQAFHEKRNSLIAENVKAGEELQRLGHRVVFIPDSTQLQQTFGRCESSREAALDSEARIALMSIAKVNIGSGSGAMALAWFTKLPLIMLISVIEEYEETSARMWRKFGIPVGSVPRFNQPNQFTVWEPDTADNIIAAFHVWEAKQVREACCA